MAKTKNQLLSELYAIKAGLSVISLEKEKVVKEENKATKAKNAHKNNEKSIKEVKAKISSLEKSLEENKKLNDSPELLKKETNKKPESKAKKVFNTILIILGVTVLGGVIGAIVGIPVWLISTFWTMDFDSIGTFLLWGLIIGLGIGFVGGTIMYIVTSALDKSKGKKKEKKEFNDKVSKVKSEIINAEHNLASNKKQLKTLEGKTKTMALESETCFTTYKKVADTSVKASKVLYESLVKEYNDTIIESEWGNLDLIIYYIETGRADTVKEALQQMDNKKQHDALLSAIKEATDSICGTIHTSLNTLRTDMNICFSNLSSQIEKQHSESMKALKGIKEGIETSNKAIGKLNEDTKEKLNEITSQAKMQSALLKKIDTNTADLVSDVNYMLTYRTIKSA